MTGRPLTFWHVAGDIIWRADGRPKVIDAELAEGLRATYSAEARCAYQAGDRKTALHAAQLWLDLTHALDGLALYRRVLANDRALAA